MPYQKSIEEYRRDIFALKTKLKQEEKYLEQVKQKYSEVDIFGELKGYSFNLKLKIHEYNLNAIKEKLDKYKKDQAYDFYALNFASLALLKATEVFMINRQMIFRAIDIKNQKKVTAFEFSSFLRNTLKLNEDFVKPIVEILDTQNKGITKERYTKYLECFLMESEQTKKQVTAIDEACANIAKQIITYNHTNTKNPIDPEHIWKAKQINIAILGHGLVKNIANDPTIAKIAMIDKLDCIGFYCKLDPTKKGFVETKNVVNYLVTKINDVKSFGIGSVKLQKS